MKQIITSTFLLTLIIVLIGCSKKNIPAQNIDYDFLAPKIDKAYFAEPRQPINLNLKNINPNIYKVTVSDSTVVDEKQKPNQFDNFFTKMPELKPVTETVNTTPTNPDAIEASPTKKNTDLFKDSDKAYILKKGNVNLLDSQLILFLTTDYSNIKEDFETRVNYIDVSAELKKWATDCSLSLLQRTSKADAYIQDMLFGINVAAIPVGIEAFVNAKIAALKLNLMQGEEKANELIKKYISIKESVTPSMTLEQFRVIEKNVAEKIDKLKAVLENISKMRDKVKELEKQKPGAAIADGYKNILASQVDITIPKYISRKGGDEYLLKVNIERKETSNTCTNEPTSFTLPVYVEKGVKIDFSTGVVFNFGKNKFFDQKYRYDSVYRANGSIADSVKISKRSNNNISQVSIGAFGHVYTRIRRDFNLGGMFGVSLSADQRVYYHAGISALIGKNDRFIISSGISIAKAKYLDTQYDADQVMKRSLAPTTIPVEEVTKAGFFISLSYNLNLIK